MMPASVEYYCFLTDKKVANLSSVTVCMCTCSLVSHVVFWAEIFVDKQVENQKKALPVNLCGNQMDCRFNLLFIPSCIFLCGKEKQECAPRLEETLCFVKIVTIV